MTDEGIEFGTGEWWMHQAARLSVENERLQRQNARAMAAVEGNRAKFDALNHIADMAKQALDVCDPASPHAARFDEIHEAAVAAMGEV